MSFDYFADLATAQACPQEHAVEASGLASGFVDGCTTCFAVNEVKAAECDRQLKVPTDAEAKKDLERKKREHDRAKNDARRCYLNRAEQRSLALPRGLALDPWPPTLLHGDWLALEVEFELLTPWYSKDDRLFHVLDNPVRKDRVFGVPFMAAASWKGMLRWACRMQAGLRGDPNWILHLFGNEKGADEDFREGALVFYPTWFDKIGFEVINPHDRSRRAGKQPIYYEVVPGRRPKPNNPDEYEDGGKGALHLLYAPWPGMRAAVEPKDFLPNLLKAIETLLTTYGISAKRTVGWGTGKTTEWRALRKDKPAPQKATKEEFENWKRENTSREHTKFWEYFWEEKIAAWYSAGDTP